MWPLIPHGQSDTASLDNALELLIAGGYGIAHAMMMLMPEAWAGNALMDAKRRAFYEYHAALMEPWDGPAPRSPSPMVARSAPRSTATVCVRPRFSITRDDLVCMASESGVLPFREEDIVRKWRLQPGRMLLIDLEQGRIIEDEEIKAARRAEPYEEWLDAAQYKLKELDVVEPSWPHCRWKPTSLLDRQQAFGYTQEDISKFLEPMAIYGEDPLGSMGTDTPIAVLSKRSRLLYDYFKQNFAQVTNPPIDPIREELVMSLVSMIGPRPNLLGRDAGTHKRLEVAPADPDQRGSGQDPLGRGRARRRVPDRHDRHHLGRFDRRCRARTALKEMCWAATEAVLADKNILILSDRAQNENPPCPRCWRRRRCTTTSSVRACACRPALSSKPAKRVKSITSASLPAMAPSDQPLPGLRDARSDPVERDLPLTTYDVQKNYIKAIGKGILKVMSKMGISTYQSYCGAQIFDAIGLSSAFVEKYFTGTATSIEGVGLKEIAEETVRRHAAAYGDNPIYRRCSTWAACTSCACAARNTPGPRRTSPAQHAVRATSRTSTRNSPSRSTTSPNGCSPSAG
jgi:glutamate synthase (NADPH/NADH) large chain